MEGWQTRGVNSSISLNRLLALKLRNFMSGNILGGGLVRVFIGHYLVGLEIENQGLPARASSGSVLSCWAGLG